MTYHIKLDERAIREAQDAYEYYEKQKIGLGESFKNELNICISSIQKNQPCLRK